MHTVSGKVSRSWLLFLCLIVLGISLIAMIVVLFKTLPLWKIVLFVAGIYGGMFTIAMIFLFALAIGILGEKK